MEFVSDFVSEPDNAAIIKVVGIGGGGCNATGGAAPALALLLLPLGLLMRRKK